MSDFSDRLVGLMLSAGAVGTGAMMLATNCEWVELPQGPRKKDKSAHVQKAQESHAKEEANDIPQYSFDPSKPETLKKQPEVFNRIKYDGDFSGICYDAKLGKGHNFVIQRLARYDTMYDTIEEIYGLDKGVLKAIVNVENTYGAEVAIPPAKKDSGELGLGQFIPSTAKSYGLDVTNARKARSECEEKVKPESLRRNSAYHTAMVGCMSEKDDRADPLEVLDATARHLTYNKIKNGNDLEKAVGVRNSKNKKYAQTVYNRWGNLQNKKLEELAINDFNERNADANITWDDYTAACATEADHWGLGEYKQAMMGLGKTDEPHKEINQKPNPAQALRSIADAFNKAAASYEKKP